MFNKDSSIKLGQEFIEIEEIEMLNSVCKSKYHD